MRGATHAAVGLFGDAIISTHAPLAGRDYIELLTYMRDSLISTHAPLAGRDGRGRASRVPPRGNFNPRAPCGARPPRLGGSDQTAQISTHAPLAGRDFRGVWVNYLRSVNFNPRAPCGARLIAGSTRQSTAEFQPTRPLRGATRHGAGVPRAGGISTHAPLAGRDQALRPRKTHTDYFNPRAPCGARRPIK